MTRLGAEYRERAGHEMPLSDIRDQMPVLYAWARHATRIIELGVRRGYSTSAFLAGLEDHGELWSVDVTAPAVPDYWLNLDAWHLLVADNRDKAAVAWCPDGADVLFIDTSHYYQHTLDELRLYVPKVRPGGVVLMHDTGPGWPDVATALNDYGRPWYDHPGWPGLGVLEIRED